MKTETLLPDKPKTSVENTDVLENFDINSRLANIDWEKFEASKNSIAKRTRRGAHRSLSLFLAAKKLELVIDLLDTNIFGRSYPDSQYFDGIDFSAYDAYRLGVSRDHLFMLCHNDEMLIIDNNSTNGTYLNLKRLQPQHVYRVFDNDRIHLAQLEFVVKRL